ncbi:MaoC family dehydratase [Nocardioides sp. NPDC057767]|uniref:MaoC family dehydratase n=1 Tax=unclassified Nocardioides TaxID=2615069 RepID=UPI00366E5048
MTGPRVFSGMDAVQAAVGTVLGTSEWVIVAQDRVDLFADATGDHQWIHVDPVRAAEGPFGTTIAHGYLTLSMIPTFLAETYAVEGISSVLNYGLDSVRFPHPVRVGSRVRGTVTLETAEKVELGLRIVLKVVVELENVAKPACVATIIHHLT